MSMGAPGAGGRRVAFLTGRRPLRVSDVDNRHAHTGEVLVNLGLGAELRDSAGT
jgi:hypothetical protein